MSKKFLTSSGLVTALVLFLAVNVLSNQIFTSARVDLTEHGLYSLSDGTHTILQELEEPVTLRFYLSKNLAPLLPGISGFVTRVKELLQEFEQASDGNLTLHILDPEPFSEEEDRAVEYGLKGVPLADGDTVFYFGLVGTGPTDEEKIIPFFQPDREEFLEYDLAKLVHQLAYPKQKVVGLLSSLPLNGGPASPFGPGAGGGSNPPWMIHDQMQQTFELRSLPPEASEIPEDIDVLMIVHPKSLKDPTLYAIDQFVLKGGRALIFVDPFAEADQSGGMPTNPMGGGGPKNSDLPKLFAAWGLELVPGKVLGDLTFARRVQYRQGTRIQAADYPVWMDLPTSQFNSEEVVTAQLPRLTLASAGILKKKEEGTTNLLPLIQSDDQAMQIDVARVQFVRDIGTLLDSYTPEGETFTLAARITGTVNTAFPDGSPSKDNSTTSQPHMKESPESINVIVVADTDMLQDYFWVQVQTFLGQRIGIPTASNGTFVINALDNLTGSNDLISIRTRAGFNRPFTLVRSLQREAEQRFREQEEQLQKRKSATERKIQELQSQKDDRSATVLSPEQEQEIVHFRQELVQVRKDLRSVQHELRKNINSLEGWLKMLNIGLMPLLIGLGGLFFSRRNPKRHSPEPGKGKE